MTRYYEIKTYPYGTNAFRVCENEMLKVKDLFFEKIKIEIVFKKYWLHTTSKK